MTIHAFRNMAPVYNRPYENNQLVADFIGVRNGSRFGKRILCEKVNDEILAQLPDIKHVGQYNKIDNGHYYIWPTFDQYDIQMNPYAASTLFVCAVATLLTASLSLNYFKLLAIIPTIGGLFALIFIRQKVPHDVQLHWVQQKHTLTMRYDPGHETTATDIPITPQNQWDEMPTISGN